jgi:hypothetical protein
LAWRHQNVLSENRTTIRIPTIALFALVLLWIGTLLGVSFLATPAKFLAPSLTLPVALDVGRQTFAILNKLEWLYSVTAFLLVAYVRRWTAVAGLGVVAFVVLTQTLWMLPALDARVGIIIAGGLPPPSRLHDLFIFAEIAKLIVLSALAVSIARQLAAPVTFRSD